MVCHPLDPDSVGPIAVQRYFSRHGVLADQRMVATIDHRLDIDL